MRRALVLAALASCRAAPAPATPLLDEDAYAAQEVVSPYVPYATRRAAFATRLSGPELAAEPADSAPEDAREIRYRAEVGDLRAWYARPPRTEGKKLPVVVYLHNDFSLRAEAWNNARPFLAAGYALLVPGMRGEDGGPGTRELLLGEVNDAKAAIAWARAQPDHAAACVSVIGHSIGGGVASMLSLHADAGVRRTASVGGVYRAHTFHAWARRPSVRGLVRFDLADAREIQMRLLIPNVRDVKVPHIAYAGADDEWDDRYAQLAATRARQAGAPVEWIRVDGDHMGSIAGAVKDFLVRLAKDACASISTDTKIDGQGPVQ